jgi:hypothetical protein
MSHTCRTSRVDKRAMPVDPIDAFTGRDHQRDLDAVERFPDGVSIAEFGARDLGIDNLWGAARVADDEPLGRTGFGESIDDATAETSGGAGYGDGWHSRTLGQRTLVATI